VVVSSEIIVPFLSSGLRVLHQLFSLGSADAIGTIWSNVVGLNLRIVWPPAMHIRFDSGLTCIPYLVIVLEAI
jgi:hypothetical protein